MRKVGVITFHSSINYGVYLQAYALQQALNTMGFSSEIIDYNRMIEGNADKQNGKSIIYRVIHFKDTIRAVRLRKFRLSSDSIKRNQLFSEFSKKHFILSEKIDNYKELMKISGDYDFFVCGSDQIWNPNYTRGNPAYFLAFAEPHKRVMYAPSYGVSDISLFEEYRDAYKSMINELHGLSVRESSGVELTEQLSGRTPKVVVDPTLLLSSDEWKQLEQKPDGIPEKYILFYVLGNDKRYTFLADKLSKECGIKIIAIPTTPIWKQSDNIHLVYAGVTHFLYLINHADFVVTDSFHGVAFSTIFRKQFTAIQREDTQFSLFSRIEDYLCKVNLTSNCKSISYLLENSMELSTNYDLYEQAFSEWQKESLEYLRDSLLQEG